MGKRKNGVEGAIVDMPWSAISSAAIPRSMSSFAFSKLIFGRHRMRPCVVRDGVALRGRAPHELGKLGRRLADQEECGSDALLRERCQHFFRVRRPGPVVEGQHNFVVGQAQGLRKTL